VDSIPSSVLPSCHQSRSECAPPSSVSTLPRKNKYHHILKDQVWCRRPVGRGGRLRGFRTVARAFPPGPPVRNGACDAWRDSNLQELLHMSDHARLQFRTRAEPICKKMVDNASVAWGRLARRNGNRAPARRPERRLSIQPRQCTEKAGRPTFPTPDSLVRLQDRVALSR